MRARIGYAGLLMISLLAAMLMFGKQPEKEVQDMSRTYTDTPIAGVVRGEDITTIVPERTYYLDIPLSCELQELLHDACDQYPDVPFELALSVIWKETAYRNIDGDGGESIGFMQVKEKYQAERMARLGITDLRDPYSNFLCGIDLLNELWQKYSDWHVVLIIYNYGEAGADEYVFGRGYYTTGYSRAVLAYMADLVTQFGKERKK